MAVFNCMKCGAEGGFATLHIDHHCLNCGSADGVRISMTMDDYPAGHPFWNELAETTEGSSQTHGSKPNKKVPT